MTKIIFLTDLSGDLYVNSLIVKEIVKTGSQCFHCGDAAAAANPIVYDDKPFCCDGCVTVYRVLNENGLQQYYELNSAPGTKSAAGAATAFLDADGIEDDLLDFREGDIALVSLRIPAIHCSSCIWLLENLHDLSPGVIESRVNFGAKTARIRYNASQTSLREIADLLIRIGYAPDFEKKDEQISASASDKKILYRLGVAGFCFGNIMLISFPEYLGLDDPAYTRFFRWLNLLFALPVIFYAATPYLSAAWKGIRHKSLNMDVPIALGILTIFIRSTYDIVSGTGEGFMDSLAGLTFFLLIGSFYKEKTFAALSFERKYKSFFPMAVERLRDGISSWIRIHEISKGDRIRIRNGELIPADCVIMDGRASIDYSFVTGESLPVNRKAGDKVFAGGRQNGEALSLEVIKPVDQSYLTSLWNGFESGAGKAGIRQLADEAGKWFTWAVLGIALATAISWLFIEPENAIHATTSVLIIACPCALALAAPFALGTAIRLLGRQKIYIKNATVIESLSKVDALVFDKTGTITESGRPEVIYKGDELTPKEQSAIQSLASQTIHPLSQAIVGFLKDADPMKPDAFEEIPGKGIRGKACGLDIVIGSAVFTGASVSEDAFAGGQVFVRINGEIRGRFLVRTPLRKGIRETFAELAKDYPVSLLTGDRMENTMTYRDLLPSSVTMVTEAKPDDKMAYIQKLQAQGRKVLMAGDGLNDAGALKAAEVGLAVTENSAGFTPASDIIADAAGISGTGRLIRFARKTLTVIRICFGVSFLYNIAGLALAVQGLLSPVAAAILMPVSTVTVVALATGLTWLYFNKLYKVTIDGYHPKK